MNSLPVMAEHLFLRDGSIINGTVLSETPATVVIKNDDGKIETVPRAKVLRLLYTKISMGKIYVQMRDGGNFEAYIVDEDQNSFFFRKVLNEPDEIQVNRSDILFIADRNPSGLKGDTLTDRVSLSWFKPYNPVKNYLLYYKENNEQSFRTPITIKGTSYTITELLSNTTYIFKVTAVDDTGDESLPSNLLTVTTKNIPPGYPDNIELTGVRPDGEKPPQPVLKWEAAKDPDGTIKEYRVYHKKGKDITLLGKTGDTFFVLPEKIDKNEISIRSVDDRGDESADAYILSSRYFSIFFHGAYLIPLNDFGKMFESGGGGGVISFTSTGHLIKGLDLGIEIGCYYFNGELTYIDHSYMIPFTAVSGYRFEITDWFAVIPQLKFGGSINTASYDPDGSASGSFPEFVNKSSFGLIFSGGLSFEFTVINKVKFKISADYYGMVENRLFDFVSIGSGVGIMF